MPVPSWCYLSSGSAGSLFFSWVVSKQLAAVYLPALTHSTRWPNPEGLGDGSPPQQANHKVKIAPYFAVACPIGGMAKDLHQYPKFSDDHGAGVISPKYGSNRHRHGEIRHWCCAGFRRGRSVRVLSWFYIERSDFLGSASREEYFRCVLSDERSGRRHRAGQNHATADSYLGYAGCHLFRGGKWGRCGAKHRH